MRGLRRRVGEDCISHRSHSDCPFSFDVDLPIDCDDEFWDNDDPVKRFQQPEGKPSKITAFILFIKLFRILSITLWTVVRHHFTLETIYNRLNEVCH